MNKMLKFFPKLCRAIIVIFLIYIFGLSILYIQRDPSADIFEALNRKLFLEEEVRDFVLSDPSLISATNTYGQTTFYLVASRDNVSLADLMISKGADVNQTDNLGNTPLASACNRGNTEMVNFLLKNGADPNIANEEGRTPLHTIIMWSPEELEIFKLVVANGGRLDVLTNDGRSMIDVCRDRRDVYAKSDFSGSKEHQRKMLEAYNKLEAYIMKESQ